MTRNWNFKKSAILLSFTCCSLGTRIKNAQINVKFSIFTAFLSVPFQIPQGMQRNTGVALKLYSWWEISKNLKPVQSSPIVGQLWTEHIILKIRNLRGANFFLSVKEDGPMFSPKYGVGFISALQLIKKIFNVECKKRSKCIYIYYPYPGRGRGSK